MANKETYIIEQKLTTDNSELISGNKKAKTSVNALGGAIEGATGKVKKMISPVNLGAVAVTVLGYKTLQAVKNFAAYEKQMSSVNTLLKVSREELADYGNSLIDIAVKVGTTKEELANGAYQALSAGVESSELLNFMETAAKGAAAGMTDVETATDVLTSTINGFKLETEDANVVMDKLITIQNNGKIVLGEMSTVMGDVADISNSLGVDLDNVGAALSTITMNGTPAAQAGTRIKAMFSELSKEGTTAYNTFQQITGESFKEFITEGGNLGEALEEMEKYAKSTGGEMIDLWSSVEAGQGAMGVTGKNAEAFTDNLNAMKNSAGELETAYQLVSANISTEWTKLTGTMNKKWMELVTKMRDPILVTLQVIRKGIGGETDDDLRNEAINSLSEAEKKITKLKQEAAELESQIAESENNPTWWSEKGWGGSDSLKIKLANIQEALKKATWEYEKANNDIAALDAKNSGNNNSDDGVNEEFENKLSVLRTEQAEDLEAFLSKISTLKEENALSDEQIEEQKIQFKISQLKELESLYASEEGMEEKALEYKKEITLEEANLKSLQATMNKERLDEIKDYEEAHSDAINQIDIGILKNKKAFYEDLNSQYESGQITKEEYDKKAASYEEEISEEQSSKYAVALEELKAFYESVGEITKANEIEKQILEIEVEANISIGEGYEEDTALKEFLASQLEAEKEFKSQLAELEANFQYEMLTLKSQGEITDGEFAQKKLDHQNNILTMTQEHDLEMLEEERDFYALQKKDMVKALEIEAEIIEKKAELKEEEQDTEEKYASLKAKALDIAENVTTTAYANMVNGTESFGEAIENAMKEQLSAYLLSAGEEMAWKAVESTALAVYYTATGNPLASEAYASAALNAAGAAAFGVAAKSLSTSSDDSDVDDDYDYDDDDVSTTEDTASDTDDDSTTIYVNVDDSTMAKNMISILEDELNDEYNVSIIGKKK